MILNTSLFTEQLLAGREEPMMRVFLVPALLVLVLVVGVIDDASAAGRRRGKSPPPAARNRKKVRSDDLWNRTSREFSTTLLVGFVSDNIYRGRVFRCMETPDI